MNSAEREEDSGRAIARERRRGQERATKRKNGNTNNIMTCDTDSIVVRISSAFPKTQTLHRNGASVESNISGRLHSIRHSFHFFRGCFRLRFASATNARFPLDDDSCLSFFNEMMNAIWIFRSSNGLRSALKGRKAMSDDKTL